MKVAGVVVELYTVSVVITICRCAADPSCTVADAQVFAPVPMLELIKYSAAKPRKEPYSLGVLLPQAPLVDWQLGRLLWRTGKNMKTPLAVVISLVLIVGTTHSQSAEVADKLSD